MPKLRIELHGVVTASSKKEKPETFLTTFSTQARHGSTICIDVDSEYDINYRTNVAGEKPERYINSLTSKPSNITISSAIGIFRDIIKNNKELNPRFACLEGGVNLTVTKENMPPVVTFIQINKAESLEALIKEVEDAVPLYTPLPTIRELLGISMKL